MVTYRKSFIFSVLTHALILLFFIMHLMGRKIGSGHVEVIQASLYSSKLDATQTHHTVNQMEIRRLQENKSSNKGIYKVRPQVSGQQYKVQQQQQVSKKITMGSHNKLLEIIHDRISMYQIYPQQAVSLDQTGNVQVEFNLAPSGQISDIRLLHSSGFFDLDNAALMTLHAINPINKVASYLSKSQLFVIEINFN